MPECEEPTAADDYKPNPENSTGGHAAVPGFANELEGAEENKRKQELTDEIQKKVGGVHAREKCDNRHVDSQSEPVFLRGLERYLA
jgi:hypothetical protein